MHYYLVAPNSVVRADEYAFTYHHETQLAPGTLVRMAIGSRTANGIVLRKVNKPIFKTKAISSVLTEQSVPTPLLTLASWMTAYYATHFATVLQTILPSGLHKQRRVRETIFTHPKRERTNFVLNDAQQAAVKNIIEHQNGTILLHGVTGSGKTQVYIEAARHIAALGQSTIVLVPEIALTPQLVAEFANHFDALVVTHSGLTEADRHKTWQYVLEHQDKPLVIIGPRSALFMPIANLGLIVVDECHEPSYKQEQAPRYSALRAASVLARAHQHAKVLLGSATPSVSDYYLAKSTKSTTITLSQPAKPITTPEVEVIDLKVKAHFTKHRFLSNSLLSHIEHTLNEGRQALLFHNRRGTAPNTICEHCGWLAECPVCYMPLTLHADQHVLRCHLCNYSQPVSPSCPACGEPTVIFKGIGTKLIEAEIAKQFPKAHIARFDADTHSTQALHQRYQELYDGSIDIMIGTQVLAKGLDLPHLGVVGVIQADSGLMLPDYQSVERVFQLLYQVIGRAGRSEHASRVIIQTFQPNHHALQTAIARDYTAFYESEIQARAAQRFPPFRYLLKLTCNYKTESGAVNASRKLAKHLQNTYKSIDILGPTPSFYERLGGGYRWQIVIKSKRRETLSQIAAQLPAGWQADLDPANLL